MTRQHNNSTPIIKAASACVWRGDEVLLVQRASPLGRGLWSLPGGKVEEGETTLGAAKRELFEETGVTATLQQFVGDYRVDLADFSYLISCFAGHYLHGDAVANTDAAAVMWLNWQNLSAISVAPNTQSAVRVARTLTSV